MVFRLMRKCLLPVLLAGALSAASIRGTVVENQTSRPLARARVELQPLPGNPAEPESVRADRNGAFEFPGLGAGSYLVTAERPGFAPVEYGQKHWKAAGVPVQLESTGSADLTIRMPHFGAINGLVLDENEVGLPKVDVLAYRATRPLQLAARAQTDDHGRYRISGLEPGKYFVRTAAHQFEDVDYLPTFHPNTSRPEQADAVEVELDRETGEIHIHPEQGRLVTLSGTVSPPMQINVTLVSDTGADTALSDSSGNFQFHPAAPGRYELYAQAPGDGRRGIQAAYQTFTAYADRNDLRLTLRPLPQIQFFFEDNQGQRIDYHSVRLLARRKDLAGTGKPQTLELSGDQLAFLPGRWELALAPVRGYYVSRFSGPHAEAAESSRADGWNELLINGNVDQVQFVLSPGSSVLEGRVTPAGHDSAAGAPVYLESLDSSARRRVKDLEMTHADAQGRYRFPNLAPGNYRVFSSFDFEAPDGQIDSRGAKAVRIEESRETNQDLELF